MLTKEIADYLQSLDEKIEAFDGFSGEHSIGQGIKEIMTKKGATYEPTVEDMAERAAFDFTQDYPGDGAGWGTYYGPMFILEDPKNKGVMNEYPSINRINLEVIEYWHTRALEAINPILKTRYADLVIDFSGKVLGKKMDFQEMCKVVIKSSIDICEYGYLHGILCRTKIERALHLAILLGDKVLIKEVKEAIIRLEDRTGGDDDSPGLWGYAFELLALNDDFKEKVEITEEEKNDLIGKLEVRLARLKGNPNSLDRAVTLLAEYYSSQKDENNLIRVLKINEESQIGNDKNIEEPLLRINAYNRIRQIYQMYGDKGFSASKEAEKRVLNEMGSLDIDWDKSLNKTVSASVTITDEEIEKYIDSVFRPKGQALSLVDTLSRVAFLNLHKREKLEKEMQKEASKFPLQYLFPMNLLGEKDLQIAIIGSIQEEPEKHLRVYASRSIQLSSINLDFCIDELKRIFSKEEIITHFADSSIFQREDQDYLKECLGAYLDGNYILASHLFIPIIETGFRELVRDLGGTIFSYSPELNGYSYYTLTSFIGDKKHSQANLIDSVFSKLVPNITFYFRSVLIDQLGMNLRNDFAHGFGKKERFFKRSVSDRLFHIMLCLSLIIKSKSE